MTPRDALMVGLGALAYPLGIFAACLVARRSPVYR